MCDNNTGGLQKFFSVNDQSVSCHDCVCYGALFEFFFCFCDLLMLYVFLGSCNEFVLFPDGFAFVVQLIFYFGLLVILFL